MNRVYVLAYEASTNTYRVLVEHEKINTNKQSVFKYELNRVTEQQLKNFYMKNQSICMNFALVNGRIKTTRGDISRYTLEKNKEGGVRIILATVVNLTNEDDVLGYRIADKDGAVKRISLVDAIKIGVKYSQNGYTPFANAILVQAAGRKPHYKSYVAEGFPTERIPVNRTTPKAKPAVIPKPSSPEAKAVKQMDNKEASNKLSDIFSPEQLKELRACKVAGVNPRVIANPKLSAMQMRVVWLTEKEGYKGRVFADPAYPVENMEFLRCELETKTDIRSMLNPKFNIDQLYALSYAYVMGANMTKIADPSIPAKKMDQMVDDECQKIWRDFKVIEGKGITKA